jgi:undecaprenyl-diphosphatase
MAIAGAAFGLLWLDVRIGDGGLPIDRPAVRYLAEHRTTWLTTVMRDLTWLGSTTVLLPLILVVGVALLRSTRTWRPTALLALSLLGAKVLSDSFKALVGRDRPRIGPVVATASGHSFPSGHATQVTAVAITLAVLGAARTTSRVRQVAAWSVAAVLSLTVGFSRVYLGVHWPTDVLAGFALGSLWALLCIRVSGHALDPTNYRGRA